MNNIASNRHDFLHLPEHNHYELNNSNHAIETSASQRHRPNFLKQNLKPQICNNILRHPPSTLYPPPLPKDPKNPKISTIQEITMLPTSSMSHRNHKSHKNHEDQQESKQNQTSTSSALDKEKNREFSHDEETKKMRMWSNLEPRECRHGQWFL